MHFDIDAYIKRLNVVQPLADAIHRASNWRERLSAISRYYSAVERDIRMAPVEEWAYDVYEVDWPMLFTPIEAALWSDIRQLGLPLYPQFPVRTERGTFYADFASPGAKVAIECDGKAFHADALRDRQRRCRNGICWLGGVSLTGRECREDFNEETLQRSTVAKSLERIARMHFDPDVRLGRAPSSGTFE